MSIRVLVVPSRQRIPEGLPLLFPCARTSREIPSSSGSQTKSGLEACSFTRGWIPGCPVSDFHFCDRNRSGSLRTYSGNRTFFSFGQDARGNERKSRTILRLRGLEHQAGGPGYPLIDRGQGYVKREPAFFIGYLPLGEPPVRQSIRRILSGQDHDIYCEIPGWCLKST